MHPLQEKILQLAQMRDLSTLSYREIGRQLSEGEDAYERVHPQNVKYHIDRLIDAEKLSPLQRPVAKVAMPDKHQAHLISIPIYGYANCGPATFFADNDIKGFLKISPTKLKSKNYQELFALIAEGESMNMSDIHGQNIQTGDFVVIDKSRRTPKEGERVVVVNNDMANIKKIYFDHDEHLVVLRSESNIDYNPIYVDPNENWDGLIGGTVIQVVKDHVNKD
jgi:SOS-response transcriptional repressor LexA